MSLVTVLQERLKALDHLEANAHQLASPKADTLKACLKKNSFKNEGVGVGPFGMKQFMWNTPDLKQLSAFGSGPAARFLGFF